MDRKGIWPEGVSQDLMGGGYLSFGGKMGWLLYGNIKLHVQGQSVRDQKGAMRERKGVGEEGRKKGGQGRKWGKKVFWDDREGRFVEWVPRFCIEKLGRGPGG